jgi:hypothetical protein
VNRYLSRKSFVTTLGAAGLGLAAATAGRAPSAMAQEGDTGPADEMMEDFGEKRVELYNAFTAALASELNIASADEVDGAIRIAIMAVIDGEVGDDGLTAGQAEALKVLVATSDVPIPAMAFGAGPGMFFKGHGQGPGFGMGEGSFGPGRSRVRSREHYEGASRESDGPAEESESAEEDSSS